MIENLKTNDQVNPDAANSVECDEQRSPAARVERIVRPVLREYGECDASDMSEESRHRWDEIAKENSKSCDEFLAARKLYV